MDGLGLKSFSGEILDWCEAGTTWCGCGARRPSAAWSPHWLTAATLAWFYGLSIKYSNFVDNVIWSI